MRKQFSYAPVFICICGLILTACATQPVTEPAPTVEYLSGEGVYQVESYTELPDVPEYGDATVYYPADKATPFGAVAISPGFTESQNHMSWWGPRLASHGFAVLTFNTNEPRDRPDARAAALMAAVDVLRGENSRAGSPLHGKLDTDKMAVMGHSMGGGGALLAAHSNSDKIKASIPFTPWQPNADFSGTTAPTLVIAGETDRIAAVADHAWPHYQAIPDSTTKVYLEFTGGNHFIGNTERSNLEVHPHIGRFAVAWLKLYVDGDRRYHPFVYGGLSDADDAIISRYITNEM
ncbi:MAG: alpha/beta hydrolase [Cellvibrionaceae bacterium]